MKHFIMIYFVAVSTPIKQLKLVKVHMRYDYYVHAQNLDQNNFMLFKCESCLVIII